MQRRIPDFPDSYNSWNFLSSIGSGITFLSFAIFFLLFFSLSSFSLLHSLNSCDHMLLSLANFQHMSCYLLGEISLTFCKISVPKLSSFSYQHPSLSRLIVQVLWIIIKFHLIPEQISIIKIRMLKINTIS